MGGDGQPPAAAAATPLIGRLADLHNKKHVLLGVLVIVLIGSVLAATTTSLALLIVARVLQGVSYSLYPICVAMLRDELPEGQVVGALAVLSGTLGFGGGAGLVVTGLLMDGAAGYHRVFWLTTGFIVVVIWSWHGGHPVAAGGRDGTIDWLGAVGLAAGPVGGTTDHHAGQHLGLGVSGDHRNRGRRRVILVGWWRGSAAGNTAWCRPTMLTRRAVLLTNLATIFVGMGLYFGFLGLTQFVQIDRANRRIRFQRIGFARQRGVPAARRADRVRHRDGQRQIHRPLRRATGAGRAGR